MNYFLAKTEPGTYSLDDLERDRRTSWDGVTNPQAVRAIREMKPGDIVFIYHSGGVSSVVGMATVKSEPHDDPKNPKSAVVDLEFAGRLESPVTLAEIKQSGKFDDLGAGPAGTSVDDGGARKVRRLDSRAESKGQDLDILQSVLSELEKTNSKGERIARLRCARAFKAGSAARR